MGSGTTLLRLVVDSHPRIAIPQETGFMRAARAHRFIPFWVFGATWFERLGWSEQELDEHMRGFYEVMFGRFAKDQGKVRWGEKTPWHVWHIDAMAAMFPDAAFVAIVRHPGGNVASNMTRFDYTLRRRPATTTATTARLLGRPSARLAHGAAPLRGPRAPTGARDADAARLAR